MKTKIIYGIFFAAIVNSTWGFSLEKSPFEIEYPIVNFERMQVLHIQNLSTSSKHEWFDRSFLNKQSIATEDELFNAIMQQYALYKTEQWVE